MCSQTGNHPEEDLAKSSNKPDMEYKSLIILLYFWLVPKTGDLVRILMAILEGTSNEYFKKYLSVFWVF